MIRLLLVALCLVTISNVAYSQAVASNSGGAIYLNKNEASNHDPSLRRGAYVGPHVMGDSLTQLLNKFETEYVYYKKGDGAYATEEKKFVKFPIYRAVHRVNDFYVKAVKKGKVDASQIITVKKDLKMVLFKGVLLKNYYTPDVEKDLKKMKDIDQIVDYFKKIEFKG